VLINNESNRDIFSWKTITLKTPCTGSKSVTGILRQSIGQIFVIGRAYGRQTSAVCHTP
jgi:hypothetical protein